MNSALPASTTKCLHCGLPILHEGKSYCCKGCETVAQLLQSQGLEQAGAERKLTALEAPSQLLQIYDSPRFKEEFVRDNSVRFLLEGVHCLSCVWILERLPALQEGVEKSQLMFAESVLTVHFSDLDKIASTAALLYQLGYRPTPLHPSQTDSETQRLADRTLLKQIGVAAVCAGNIMLLAIPRYAGLEGSLGRFFDLLMGALFLPVLLYSAQPFFKGAWQKLKRGLVSVDTPLALVLTLAGVLSYWSLLYSGGELYFDSLSVLVFLLLSSRAFLKHLQKRHANTQNFFSFLAPLSATLKSSKGELSPILIQDIREGDILVVREGERLPCDGCVTEGEGMIQNALLTGEPIPIACAPSTMVYAGTQLLSGQIDVRAGSSMRESRLGKLIESARADAVQKSEMVSLADRISRYFVGGIILLSGVAWVVMDMNAALALLIVACPCAFGLATPLTAIRALSLAANRGIFVKNANVLERLPTLNVFAFDKTGTLTEGSPTLTDVKIHSSQYSHEEVASILQTLERGSEHPIGKMLLKHSQGARPNLECTVSIERTPLGERRSTECNGDTWVIEREPTYDGSHWTLLRCNGKSIQSYLMEDPIRPDSKPFLDTFRNQGIQTHLLTGDSESRAYSYGEDLGFPKQNIHAQFSPEDKATWVDQHQPLAFLGDGANDSLALKHATVGIATAGAMEMALQSADIYIKEHSLKRTLELLHLSSAMHRTLVLTLSFSILYNVFSVSLVFLNWVTPLTAAILMPISALIVFALSLTLKEKRIT